MRLIIEKDYDQLSKWAAEHVIERINKFNPTPDHKFVLGLPTGSSPIGMYRALAEACKEGRVSFKNVLTFNMDEYVGLPKSHPAGFGNFLDRTIWSKINLASIDYIGPERDPEESIKAYNKILEEHHIDICLMGIGENGHIAFNDPHVADFNDPARIKKVDLDLTCRTQQVHDGCFATLEEVPEYAMTLTIPTLFACDKLVCVVPAPTKANAVKATLYGPISEACPASIMRRHKDATLYVDADSGKYIE